MINRKNDLKSEIRKNMREGKGDIAITHLADQKILGEHCRLFAKIIVSPGDSIGKHPHHGEKEIYYFISGSGKAHDDEKICDIEAGDVMVTPDGHRHSIENTGKEDLVYIALILKDDFE